jgi:hypothetical protein
MGSLTCSAVSVICLAVLGIACQPPAVAASTATLRSAEPKNAKPLLPDDVERPFSPKTGMALVGANGGLVAVRLWENDAIACTSAVDHSAGAVLSLTPNVEGYRLDDRAAVLFDTRSQERRVVKVRAKVPPKIIAGTSTRMHFDIRDDGGAAVFDGDVEVLFCGQ